MLGWLIVTFTSCPGSANMPKAGVHIHSKTQISMTALYFCICYAGLFTVSRFPLFKHKCKKAGMSPVLVFQSFILHNASSKNMRKSHLYHHPCKTLLSKMAFYPKKWATIKPCLLTYRKIFPVIASSPTPLKSLRIEGSAEENSDKSTPPFSCV